MVTILYGREFARKECPECGVEYYMPQRLEDECKKAGAKKTWYCPNGHGRVYRESEADAIRRERDRLAQRIAEKDDEIKRQRDLREAAERSTSAIRGQMTKLKKRTANGVCPCCTRSFVNLRRHIETKHPEFGDAAIKEMGQ